MSSPDVFLSSPRVTRRIVHNPRGSSPELPDVHELVKSQRPLKPPLKSGSKAAPIPDDVFAGFTTARGLWQSAQAAEGPSASSLQTADPIYLSGEDDSVCIIEAPPQPKKKATRPRKPRRQKEPAQASPLPAVSATLTVPPEQLSPRTPSKEQPWRKYRPSPKSVASSPIGESLGFDAPPSAQVPVDEPRFLETDTVSKHFKPSKAVMKEHVIANCVADEPVTRESAPIRRLDWTPPAKESGFGEAVRAQDSVANVIDNPEDENQVEFKDVLREYNCSNTATRSPVREVKETSIGLGKRKLIEPILACKSGTSERPRSTSPAKRKAPKKPRTITELATAAYRIQEAPEPPPTSLLTYVAVDSAGNGLEDQVKSKGKAKPRSKASRKKAVPDKPVLLSPGAALKHVANQDFVFGTSSQLAQEKSPTFLRTLHAAMRQSNEIGEGDLAMPLNSDAVEPPELRPRLWDAAARDEDGALFDVEVINLVDASPTLPPAADEADPFGYVNGDATSDNFPPEPGEGNADADTSFLSLSEIMPKKPLGAPSTPIATAKTIVAKSVATQNDESAVILAEASNQAACMNDSKEPTLPPLPAQPQRPAYETFTDAQLAKQVSKYGFKPVKRRATMLALLDNCWKSQVASGRLNSVSPKRPLTTTAPKSPPKPARSRGRPKKTITSPSTSLGPPPSAQITTPTKKPRGRPKKDAAMPNKTSAVRSKKTGAASPTRKGKEKATAQPAKVAARVILEIPDSESDQNSIRSASRSASPEPLFSSPVAEANFSITMDDDTDMALTMTPTEHQVSLFDHLTKAVLSAPRSSDVSNPSWYEKMLLYDPIVVEDLAVWLNSGQLTSVGYDGEVSPAEVKKWCESKSVCCLWRDTHRGKERKRY